MLETSPSLTVGHDSLLVTSYLRLRGPGAAVEPPAPATAAVVTALAAPAPSPRSSAAIDHGAMLPKWLRRFANLQLEAEPLAINGYLRAPLISH
jgi:hypothetical protein